MSQYNINNNNLTQFLCENCKTLLVTDCEGLVRCPICNTINNVSNVNINNILNKNINNNNCFSCNNNINIENDDFYYQTIVICPFCNAQNKIDRDTNKVICYQCAKIFNVNGYIDNNNNNNNNIEIEPFTIRTIQEIPIQQFPIEPIIYNYVDLNSRNQIKTNLLIDKLLDDINGNKIDPVRYYQFSDVNLIKDLNEIDERRIMRKNLFNDNRNYNKNNRRKFRKYKYKNNYKENKNDRPITINFSLIDDDIKKIKNNGNKKFPSSLNFYSKISNGLDDINEENKLNSDIYHNNSILTNKINDLNIISKRKSFNDISNPIINKSYSYSLNKINDSNYKYLNDLWNNDSYLEKLNHEIREDSNFKKTNNNEQNLNMNSNIFNRTGNYILKKQNSSMNLLNNIKNDSLNLKKELLSNKSYSNNNINTIKTNNSIITEKLYGGLDFN